MLRGGTSMDSTNDLSEQLNGALNDDDSGPSRRYVAGVA